MNLNRYSRQMVLPQVGVSGQQALLKSKVLLVGAGGLGIPCAQSLVAAGVGQITIIDDDCVSLSNLQRQFLFHEADVGRPKVRALKEKLMAQNSEVVINIVQERLNIINILDLLKEHDLVIDGSDNFSTKFLINDACLIVKKPWVYGSVSRFEGQVAVFSSSDSSESSCYRCLFEKMPNSKIENCEEQGVFGAVTGIVGNYQALEALKLLMSLHRDDKEINSKTMYHNNLSIFDFHTMDQQSLYIPKRIGCSCGKPSEIDLKEEQSAVCLLNSGKSWAQFEQDSGKKILIDVRTFDEYQSSRHQQGVFWSENIKTDLLGSSSNSQNVYLYCSTGKRAKSKCIELKALGIDTYYICENI